MIKGRGEGPVDDVDLRGAAGASASPEVTAAISDARAIVIGPSNPVISIGPILETGGVRDALKSSRAPVVAVSPLVGGQVLKGPTAAFMQWAGHPLSSDGIAAVYDGLIDGLVADEPAQALPVLELDVALGTPEQRRRVAGETLRFAVSLGRSTANG
jgi:LPPG:FO 2-phospho-L-lactate transferase